MPTPKRSPVNGIKEKEEVEVKKKLFTEFYRVLPSFTEFYRVLPSFFFRGNRPQRFTGPYRVSLLRKKTPQH